MKRRTDAGVQALPQCDRRTPRGADGDASHIDPPWPTSSPMFVDQVSFVRLQRPLYNIACDIA